MPEVNGIHYHYWTDPEVIELLENFRHLRLNYGDRLTGQDWMQTDNTIGYISYSTSRAPIPLLVYNSQTSGGFPIPTECIVRISSSSPLFTGAAYWTHPGYHIDPDKAAETFTAIGERAFIRHFGQDQFDLVQLRATLLKIVTPKAAPTEREPPWPTSQV